jgi:hypothetical protein
VRRLPACPTGSSSRRCRKTRSSPSPRSCRIFARTVGTRTNLGILNLYPSPISFRLEITDGETAELAASTDVQLAANELRQLNAVLNDMAPGTKHGWARVTPVLQSGQPTQFAAYAVVNDGAEPGQGTGDGSFVLGIPE